MAEKESMSRRKHANFPASRIKKIMLGNEDIGKITPSAPVVLGRALELFLSEILSEVAEICTKNGTTKIHENDMQAVINKHEKYGFLSIGPNE